MHVDTLTLLVLAIVAALENYFDDVGIHLHLRRDTARFRRTTFGYANLAASIPRPNIRHDREEALRGARLRNASIDAKVRAAKPRTIP